MKAKINEHQKNKLQNLSKNLKTFLAITFLTIMASCSKDDNQTVIVEPAVKTKDTYVVGWQNNAASVSVAKIWINGKVKNLTDGVRNSEAKDVFVSNGITYVVGNEGKKAMLWKNGIGIALTNGDYLCSANNITIVDNIVYIVGSVRDASGIDHATLWTEGVASDIMPGAVRSTYAKGIYVNKSFIGNEIYICGTINNVAYFNGFVKLIDGTTNIFSEGVNTSDAKSIIVKNDNVYVTGNNRISGLMKATYWKDNVEKPLTTTGVNEANCTKIQIVDNVTYAIGYETIATLTNAIILWKNGTPTRFTTGTTSENAFDMLIDENNFYVVGEKRSDNAYQFPSFWINGTAKDLEISATGNGAALAVFIN